MKKLLCFIISLVTLLTLCTASQAAARTEAQFIDYLSQHYHFKKSYVQSVLQQAKSSKFVIKKMSNTAESRNWDWYYNHFITPKRIKHGLQYWDRHRKILNEAYKVYGVSPSIIVAIIGIETMYGQHKGGVPTLDALYTLAFHHSKRAQFFQKELAKYFVLCRKMHLPIHKVTGSYAGALGIPQFMPSIYLTLAKSDSNKPANLFTNNNDAILSVANYLHQHGWIKNQPIIAATLFRHKPANRLFSKRPKHSVNWYKQHHTKLMTWLWPHSKATLIQMDTKKHRPYWLASTNFFSILSYNSSKNYGMAVYQLSQKLKDQSHGRQHT